MHHLVRVKVVQALSVTARHSTAQQRQTRRRELPRAPTTVVPTADEDSMQGAAQRCW
jgi:hypothetical protein